MEAHKDEAEKHESSHEKKGDERAHIESGKEAKTAVGAARAAKKVKNNSASCGWNG